MFETRCMDDKVCCPQCGDEVVRHCLTCGWLVCTKCQITYGKNNAVRSDVKKKKRT